MDGSDDFRTENQYMELVKENICYDALMQSDSLSDRSMYEELYLLICDVVCRKYKTIRIAGENLPCEVVKSQFLKLNMQHLQYVAHSVKITSTKISNMRAYLLTTRLCTGHSRIPERQWDESDLRQYYAEVEAAIYGAGTSGETGGNNTAAFLRDLNAQERTSKEKRDDHLTQRHNREMERERSRIEAERTADREKQRIAAERAKRQKRSRSCQSIAQYANSAGQEADEVRSWIKVIF